MRSSKSIEKLLPQTAVNPDCELSDGFSALVLEKAKAVRDLARIHWRILMIASVLAIVCAVLIGLFFDGTLENRPPAMPTFSAEFVAAPDLE